MFKSFHPASLQLATINFGLLHSRKLKRKLSKKKKLKSKHPIKKGGTIK